MIESLIHEINTSRLIAIISPDEKKAAFSMGRGQDCDVIIIDVSVSRFHAVLRWKKDGFYLEDNGAKFGTLALIKELVLECGKTRMVQVGRTLVTLSVKAVEPKEKLKEDLERGDKEAKFDARLKK